MNISYNYQQRPDFTRTIAAAGFGYSWRSNSYTRHDINLIALNYVNVINLSERFQEIISGTYIENSYRSHVIPAFNYTFSYSNQDVNKEKSFVFIKFRPEIAGNLFTGLYSLSGVPKPEEGYLFFDTPYAQYIMADIDFRYNHLINPASKMVFRFFAGAGIPYGNGEVMPFEKKYFSGGSYGIRAWQVRSLGPGSYIVPEDQGDLYPNQLGDIKLEGNIEYRFDLFWLLEGAVFLDAGNIWSIREADGQAGAHFTKENFVNDIAVGTGAGVRLKLSFFLLRLDLGIKLRDPALISGPGWIMLNRSYKASDFVLNFGIDYPF